MDEVVFCRQDPNLIWEIVNEAGKYDKHKSYKLYFPRADASVPIDSSIETLSDLLDSNCMIGNMATALCGFYIAQISPLTFQCGEKVIEFCGNHRIQFYSGVRRIISDSRESDAGNMVLSYLYGRL